MEEWGSTLDGKMRKSLSKWNLRLNNWQNFRKQKSSWTLKYCCPVTKVIEPSLGSGNTRWPAHGKPVRLTTQVRPGKFLWCLTLSCACGNIRSVLFLSHSQGGEKSKIVKVTVPPINLYSLLSKMTFLMFQTHLDQSICKAGFFDPQCLV